MPAPQDASLVIETMYQVAADPEAWEQLIDVLEEGGPFEEPTPEIIRDLARSEDIARLVGRSDDEGAGSLRRARSHIGWVLLSGRGKITAANAAAHAVMGEGLGRLEIGRTPLFLDPDNTDALNRALHQICGQPFGQVILKLERDGEEGPRFAYLIPSRALPGVADVALIELAGGDEGYALVFPAVAETGRLWTSVTESFGLTPAEVRLAKKLRDGRSLQEAADDLSVSINTVRNQLRAVFDKMGLKRQSDLVRALTELSALSNLISSHDPVFEPAQRILDAPKIRQVVLSDGRRLAYREYGDPKGRAVLSFHEGLGSSLLPPGTERTAWKLGLRIVCAERPGFGQSDPHPDYSFDGVAGDMVELCDQLGFDQVRIGALLSGAPSAIQTAIRLGSRAVHVHIYSGRPPRALEETGRNVLTQFRRRLEDNPWVLETFFAILRLRLSPVMVERILRRSSTHSPADMAYLESHPETVSFIAAYIGEALARSSRGPADEVRAFRRGRNMALADLRTPLTVWHGEQDRLAPLPHLLAFLGDKAQAVHVVPAIGHFLALKHWDDILKEAAA